MAVFVQYGCGHCAPAEWVNFDASPTLRLERLPLVGRLIAKNEQRFPPNVRWGDITKGLPVPDGSVDAVYASHILEHLSRQSMTTALANTFRLLRSGGILRIVVPDLEARARLYLEELGRADPSASDNFMRRTSLGVEYRGGLVRSLSRLLGNSAHLWMWDFSSLQSELQKAGFSRIRRCAFGDSSEPAFHSVERIERFIDGEIEELAIEAIRP